MLSLFVGLLLSWHPYVRGNLSLTSFCFNMGPQRPLSVYSQPQFHRLQTYEQLLDFGRATIDLLNTMTRYLYRASEKER
jgi:hypothetical protein